MLVCKMVAFFAHSSFVPLGIAGKPIVSPQMSICRTRPYMCSQSDTPKKPRVSIEYCTGCRWGLRAAWMAQELLVTFESEMGEVALRPSSTAGTFNIWLDSQLLWCRKRDGGFPDLKDIKKRVRDIVQPDKSLGHTDRS